MEPDPPRGMRTVVVEESDWTEIEVSPFSEGRRREWIRERVRTMPSSPEQLTGKAIPELLFEHAQLVLGSGKKAQKVEITRDHRG